MFADCLNNNCVPDLLRKRVFYYNLLYTCNLDCLFCFSHNTNTITRRPEITIETFQNDLLVHHVEKGDRIVLNGGEPLSHPRFGSILQIAKATSCELTVYTNGTLVSNPMVLDALRKCPPDRMTIPIHGTEKIHDALTRRNGSWKSTIEGIKSILKYLPPKVLELKFILTSSFVKNRLDIVSMVNAIVENLELIHGIVITGQVNTVKAKANGHVFTPDDSDFDFIETQIIKCSNILPTKFYDFPLCRFSKDFENKVILSAKTLVDIPYQYYYADSKSRPFPYVFPGRENESRCLGCPMRPCCSSICNCYNVSQLFRGTITRVLE